MISVANQRGKRIQKHYAHSSSGYSQGTADVSQHPAPVFQQKTAYKLNLKSGPGVTSDPVESCFFNGRQIRQKKYWKLIKIQKVQVRKSHSVQTHMIKSITCLSFNETNQISRIHYFSDNLSPHKLFHKRLKKDQNYSNISLPYFAAVCDVAVVGALL